MVTKDGRERVRRILYVICKSEAPLSSTEIANGIRDRFDDKAPYIYKVIKKLCPTPEYISYPADAKERLKELEGPPIRFLSFIPKEKTSKRVSNAKKEYQKASDAYENGIGSRRKAESTERLYLMELRRNYRYYPNLRTLLLYLYEEYHTTTQRKKGRIRDVLSNPKIIKIAPFLEYWKDFQGCGLDMFNTFSDRFMERGGELRNQLHIKTENDKYLIRRVTERIFIEVELYLGFVLDPPGNHFLMKEDGIEKYNGLVEIRKKYRRLLVSIQRGWLEEKRESLDFYGQECGGADSNS